MYETNAITYRNYFPLFNPESVEQMQRRITLHLNLTTSPCYGYAALMRKKNAVLHLFRASLLS
jgi:hypothetical protein